MIIIYNNITGKIIAETDKNQTVETLYYHYPKKFKENIDILEVGDFFKDKDIDEYVVIDKQLIKIPDEELIEIRQYGKILTEEERLLNQLKPPYDEVAKAKNTIEMINLIQEVMI